jgi:hypothetical protein
MSESVSPARVIAAVQLQDVNVREGTFRRRVPSAKELGHARVDMSHSTRCEALPGASGFIVVFESKVQITSTDSAPLLGPGVELTCVLDLRYTLPEGFESTPEERQAFADLNGVFNAWPYFREFVQSATVRMGLPAFVVPVLRLNRGKPQTQPAKAPARPASKGPRRLAKPVKR